MKPSKTPHADAALQYARDVAEGRVPACRLTIAACKRHLDDIERSGATEYPYRFDEAKAERVCRFVELFPHTKGKWAVGRPGASNRLRLEPWQCFFFSSIFGWVRKRDNLRRYRKVYAKIPRKNGKSQMVAPLGLYMLAADNEFGAEVYSGATTEKQAWEVFRPARLMAERTPEYQDAFGVEVNASNLHIVANGSRFEPVIGKPGDGASPSCAIVDEYHEHATDELVDTMLTGMGAREQPLLVIITTAGSNVASPCYALEQDAAKVLDGALDDDELFALIYGIDPEDDWTSELALRKANPNLDVSISLEYLRARQREAISSSRKQNVFKTKHLNCWVNASTSWMNMEAWKACADAPPIEEFEGAPCYVGIDLASKVDIAAMVLLFPREQDGATHYHAYGRYYLPEDRIADGRNPLYQGWHIDGLLTATDGAVIDHQQIGDDLLDAAHAYEIAEVPFDPWNAAMFATQMMGKGLPMVEMRQTVGNLSEPMKQLEALVLSGRFHHTGDPVLTWMVSNVVAKEDAKGNIFPRKEREEAKIDGVVATLNALGRAMLRSGPDAGSTYESSDLLIL